MVQGEFLNIHASLVLWALMLKVFAASLISGCLQKYVYVDPPCGYDTVPFISGLFSFCFILFSEIYVMVCVSVWQSLTVWDMVNNFIQPNQVNLALTLTI